MRLEKSTINVGKQERQAMTFTTISRVKGLNGLQNQLHFSYDQYENMGNLTSVGKKEAKEDRLRFIIT
jgi:hypothetical protein